MGRDPPMTREEYRIIMDAITQDDVDRPDESLNLPEEAMENLTITHRFDFIQQLAAPNQGHGFFPPTEETEQGEQSLESDLPLPAEQSPNVELIDKDPVEQNCPQCDSASLHAISEGVFFCMDCDWDNLQTLTESTGEKMNKWLGFEIKDEWFTRFHVEALTESFCIWWVNFYGIPDDYSGEGGEGNRHDYYIRMAFALTGWNAKT